MKDVDPTFLNGTQFDGLAPIDRAFRVPVGRESHPGKAVPGFGIGLFQDIGLGALVLDCYRFHGL